ncbi:hypothetical protein PHMEG_00031994 [Phytophthora megakarya]|uniref:Uncharacterized protein n=1 Tax=Phytophthora megakarya TaxID=4795 RepID=A0A225UVL4_9STRA|nr:hypothetical protein PHMEG_00031994 [Phytophthora megakarya]
MLLASVLGLTPGDIVDVTTPPSGCQLCADTGDCSHGFRDGPGQYCGTWMDRSSHELPCCCPLNAVCNISPAEYTCTCAYVGVMPPYHSDSDLMNKVLWLWWILGILVLVAVIGVCGYLMVKGMTNRDEETCVYAPPNMMAPVVSPTREALYGSTGHSKILHKAEEVNNAQPGAEIEAGTGKLGPLLDHLESVALATHPTPPDDLDVGGDGFDGGLGSRAEDNEAESSDVEAEEEIALLTVPTTN